MERVRYYFPRTFRSPMCNATKHDLIEMRRANRPAGDAGRQVVMQFVRPVREGQLRVFERILGAQGRSAEPRRVLRPVDALDPEQMAAALMEFAKMLLAALQGDPADQVAIDGKVLKGAILDASSKSALQRCRRSSPGRDSFSARSRSTGRKSRRAWHERFRWRFWKTVSFDRDTMWVDLDGGRSLGVPSAWFPRTDARKRRTAGELPNRLFRQRPALGGSGDGLAHFCRSAAGRSRRRGRACMQAI